MKPVLFPSCCSADILIGMGPSYTADYEARASYVKESDKGMAESFLNQMNYAKRIGNGSLVVMINSDQQQANRVLNKLKPFGWHCSKWMTKVKHRNTKLRLWYFKVDEYKSDDPRIEQVLNKLKGDN